MKFETYPYADISTQHITQSDGRLMSQQGCPFHLSEIDRIGDKGSPGSIFYVPPDESGDWESEMDTFGFSKAFIKIFRELKKQEIMYVRFDRDGGEVEGAPSFDW